MWRCPRGGLLDFAAGPIITIITTDVRASGPAVDRIYGTAGTLAAPINTFGGPVRLRGAEASGRSR